MSPAAKPASGTSRARADEAMSSSRIDLQGLQVFEAVMRERNVTRAALSLSLSQPAVSHAITRLRLLFRDPLFLRAAGGVRPTRRAEELWLEIREPLAALRRVIVPAEFEPATAKLSVSLAVNDMLIQEHLTPWCAQLLRIAPGLRLALVTRSFGDTETRLVEGTLEFGLGLFSSLPAVLRRREVWTDRYVCVFRRGHALLKSPWTLEAFQSASHVRVLPSGERFSLADVGMRLAGMQSNVAMTVSHFTCLPGLVEATDLLAILPRSYALSALRRHALEVRDLPFPADPVRYELVWHERSEASSALVWFREALVAQFGTGAAKDG